MIDLRPCPECRRHARIDADACPFCQAQLEPATPRKAVSTGGRLTRAAVFAGAALVGSAAAASCGGEEPEQEQQQTTTGGEETAGGDGTTDTGTGTEGTGDGTGDEQTPPDDNQTAMPYGAPPARDRVV